MYQLCKHGKQDGEPCEECAAIVSAQFAQARGSADWVPSVEEAIRLIRKSEDTGWQIYATNARKLLEDILKLPPNSD